MWKNSLKIKLISIFLMIGFVAIGVAGASAIASMQKTLQEEIQNKITLLADNKEGQIYAYIDSLESRTIDFSSDGDIRDNLRNINQTGSQLAKEDLSKYLIKNKKSLDKTIDCIMIIDLNGKVVGTTTDGEIDMDVSSNSYFTEGIKSIYFGDFKEERLDFVVSMPLSDKDTGEKIGVIVNQFNSEKITNILTGKFQIEKGDTSFETEQLETLTIYLVDKDKKILVYGGTKSEITFDQIDTFPVQESLNNHRGINGEYTNHLGERVIGASVPFPKTDWTLLVEIDSKTASAPLNKLTNELIIMLSFAGLFVALSIYYASKRIVAPINELHNATDKIASGNLGYKVNIRTGDEIEKLGESFNQMATRLKSNQDQLEEYSRGLEEKVEERTKEIEEEKQSVTHERNKINAILHSIGDGVFVVDNSLNVILINDVATKMTGYKAEEIIGKKYSEKLKFVFEGTEKINDKFIIKAIKTKKIQEMANHTVIVNKSGKEIPVADSAAPLIDGMGQVAGCVVVFRDVAKEREVDRAKTEFVSLASHQLRTPATAVKQFIGMILEGYAGKLSKEQRGLVQDAYDSNERQIQIINDLLETARIEAGLMMLDITKFDITKLLSRVVLEQKQSFENKKQKVNYDKPKKPIFIMADEHKIRMAVDNLVNNANKYTPEGGTIELLVKKEKDKIKIDISDNGIGISAKDRNELFKKFHRINGKDNKNIEGSGLGLYIVKEIVDLHKGTIQVDSDIDKSTTFTIMLPMEGE